MTLRPVVFLDVDGTIVTLVDPANDYSDPRVDWAVNEDLGVRYNPAVIGWIHELDSLAEVRWLTAWVKTAGTKLAPALGLPEFTVIPNIPPAPAQLPSLVATMGMLEPQYPPSWDPP